MVFQVSIRCGGGKNWLLLVVVARKNGTDEGWLARAMLWLPIDNFDHFRSSFFAVSGRDSKRFHTPKIQHNTTMFARTRVRTWHC
jgi:hypothetical protein